jgi:hypothetical protein
VNIESWREGLLSFDPSGLGGLLRRLISLQTAEIAPKFGDLGGFGPGKMSFGIASRYIL